MQNEHQGYSFTKTIRRQKRGAGTKKILLATAMTALSGGIGYWLGNLEGAAIGVYGTWAYLFGFGRSSN